MPADQLQKQIAEFMASKSCDNTAISPGTLPNSLLPIQTANRFIDQTVDESSLLSKVRTLRVDHCQGKIPKLDLVGPVTEGATATSCPTTTFPEEKSLYYELVKYRSYFEIETDFLECNLERGQAQNTIMGMFRKGIRNDSEIAAIQSDDSLFTGDTASRTNNLLGVNDGWLKMICECIPSCNVIDAQGKSPSKDLYYDALTRVPTRFRGIMNQYRWLSGHDITDHWMYYWGQRLTNGGDQSLATGEVPGPWGHPFLPVNLWPVAIPYGSQAEPVTHVLFTPLSNLIYIIGRKLRMERERVPKCDLDYWVMHWTADYLVEDIDKIVMIKNVAVNSCAPYVSCGGYCGPVTDHNPAACAS